MVAMKVLPDVPASRDERLDELSEILARGVLRMTENERGFSAKKALEVPRETRLSVTTPEAEVT